jgi:hypothetical protein
MVRSEWQRTAFELQPLLKGPSTQMVAMMTGTVQGGLLETLVSHQKTDAFCLEVLEGIHWSDDGSWRNFSLGTDRVLRYQRPEDVGPRICVPAACCRQVLKAAHGGDVLVGHPGVTRTTAEVSRG